MQQGFQQNLNRLKKMEVIPKVSRKGKTLIFRHIFEHFLTYFSDIESLEMGWPFPPYY